MCAECHSTGVRRNYDAANDRFATSFAEISVGCEACHGQGSRHVDWARAQQSWWPFDRSEDPRKGLLVRFDERRDIAWPIDPSTGNAARNFTPALAAQGGRDLRPVPRAPQRIFRGLGARTVAFGHPCRLAACPGALSCRWADARRGLQLRLVQAEQDVREAASPAAIATSRTARNCGLPSTASACSVTRPTSIPLSRITVTKAQTRR